MHQRLSVYINVFDFKYKASAIGKSFKLRFSVLEDQIAEKNMIKGSQPLAGYRPEKSHATAPFQISDSGRVRQTVSFELTRPLDLEPEKLRTAQGKDKKFPVLVVELMVKDRTADVYAKNFESDDAGFANIGHNMLRLKLVGQEVHQAVQVLFYDVLFCSVGLAFHIQTAKFDFVRKTSKSSKQDGEPGAGLHSKGG